MRLAQLVKWAPDRSAATRRSDRVDQVRVLVRGAFIPDRIEAQAGQPLRIAFRREETASCSERVVFPSLGQSVMLPAFEDVVLELAPLPPGQYEFGCGLGVLRGRIVVRSEPAHPRIEVLGGRILVRGRTARESVESPGRRPLLSRMLPRGRPPTLRRTQSIARRSFK